MSLYGALRALGDRSNEILREAEVFFLFGLRTKFVAVQQKVPRLSDFRRDVRVSRGRPQGQM